MNRKELMPLSSLWGNSTYSLSKDTVKYWLRKRNENGFDKVLMQIGKKFYLSEEDFLGWLKSKKGS